jgi:hypothetical protein
MSIPTLSNKIKGVVGEHRQQFIFMAILVLAAAASFYLGYQARAETKPTSQVVIQCPANAYMDALALSKPATGLTKTNTNESSNLSTVGAGSGPFVASKTGKKYYPIACSSVKRIKDANKVFFGSAAAAQSAGLVLAAGC